MEPLNSTITKENFESTKTTLKELKIELFKLASAIMENPQAMVALFRDIRRLCDDDVRKTIKKYVILTELSLYSDILPGYRIKVKNERVRNV